MYVYIYTYTYNIASSFLSLFYVVFESTLLNYANPCRNWTFQYFARVAEKKGRECQNFHLFRCVLSSLLPLRSVGRSNFDKRLHNIITLIQKRHKIMIEMNLLCYIMESTVDSYEKRNTMYIYNI